MSESSRLPAATESRTPDLANRVRQQFVAMLFALTVTRIAISVADLVGAWDWNDRGVAAAAHLLVAFTLVAGSWVGWSHSLTRQRPVESLFTWPFVLLVFDVAIVVVYFVLVAGVELDASAPQGQRLLQPTATWEAWSVLVVFSLYLAWDVAARLAESREIGRRWDRVWPTLVALFLSIPPALCCRFASSGREVAALDLTGC